MYIQLQCDNHHIAMDSLKFYFLLDVAPSVLTSTWHFIRVIPRSNGYRLVVHINFLNGEKLKFQSLELYFKVCFFFFFLRFLFINAA